MKRESLNASWIFPKLYSRERYQQNNHNNKAYEKIGFCKPFNYHESGPLVCYDIKKMLENCGLHRCGDK